MKTNTETRDDHQITMTVTLDAVEMEGAKRRAARKISERKSVPGFRPGKAPYEVIVRTFGEGAILEEAVDLLLDDIYPKALEEAKIEPGAAGSLEKMEHLDKDPEFTFLVPLAPKVELGDYRSIRIPYEWNEPGDDAVEEAIQDLRQMYAKTETVDRPIAYNDFVLVDIAGKDTKSDEAGSSTIERNGFPVFIRKEQKTDEWPFSGFCQELLGATQNQVVAFIHKYPKDHPDETIRGKHIKFEATIKMVRGSILPELDDEFAKQLGPFENVQALRDSVRANLATRSRADYDDDFYTRVIDSIKTGAVIIYSPQTLDHETKHVMEDIKSRLAKQGMDLPSYLKSRDMDEAKFISEEARPTAVKRLERSLLLDEVARAEKIEISKDELDNSFQQTLYEVSGSEEFQKYLKGKSKPPKQLIEAMTIESANRAYLKQTLERLKAIATGIANASDTSDDQKVIPEKKPSEKKTRTRKTQATVELKGQENDTKKHIEKSDAPKEPSL